MAGTHVPEKLADWIWINGDLVPWEEATVHVMAHALHYGSSVFEGIRAYPTPDGPAIFRLRPHMERLYRSAKILRMEIPYTLEELEEAVKATVRANGHQGCYIRPLVFRGAASLGVDGRKNPIDVVIITFEWGRYLGPEALEQGVDVVVSSWRRMAPSTHAPMGKVGGNYVNSQLMVMQAKLDGYVEAIALDVHGYVSEGSGENLFLVDKGVIYTPPLGTSILPGITRDSVITLARDMGYEVREALIPREWLYVADELFFCGTAAEITPIRSVDRIPVGTGSRGPITQALQERFFAIVEGREPDKFGWLTPVK